MQGGLIDGVLEAPRINAWFPYGASEEILCPLPVEKSELADQPSFDLAHDFDDEDDPSRVTVYSENAVGDEDLQTGTSDSMRVTLSDITSKTARAVTEIKSGLPFDNLPRCTPAVFLFP